MLLKKIETITAIDVSIPIITWMQFDKLGNVIDWYYYESEIINGKKFEFDIFSKQVRIIHLVFSEFSLFDFFLKLI